MARWGLDGETLRAANPGLVTCSVTAFGTAEAARALPGYDFLAQAMGGLMSVTGEPGGPPLKTGAAVVDLVCGLLAVVGIQAALAERARTGAGRHVEVSLMDAALMSLLNQGSSWVMGGVVPHRRGNRHPSITPYETFAAADRPIAVAVGNDRLFARLCAAVGLPELARDARFATNSARVAHADELAARLEAVLRTRPAAEWVEALRAASVPAGPINDVAEAFALAASLGMEPVAEAGGCRCRRRRCGSTASARRSAAPRRRSTSTATSCARGCVRSAEPPAAAGRPSGSMKRTSSRRTSKSLTSSVPRSRKNCDEPLDERLGRAGAGRDADDARALEPLLLHLGLVVDQVGGGAVVARDVDEPVRVRRVPRADHQHEVALAGHLARRRAGGWSSRSRCRRCAAR